MTVLTAATVLLAVLAAVATYFVARASMAIVDLRHDIHNELVLLHKQSKAVLKQAMRTERTSNRIMDKLYHQHQDIEEMLTDPSVQRALRKEGRR